jgi:hypothetical protein
MTGTQPESYMKTVLIVSPIAFLAGFIFVQAFWSMAPMPSALYPGIQMMWPIQAINQSIFIAGERFIRFDWLIGGAIVAAISYMALYHLGWGATFIGMVAGISTTPPYALATIIGAVLGLIFQRKFGDMYRKNVATIVAGVSLGLGFAVGIGSAICIILRGIWVKPF